MLGGSWASLPLPTSRSQPEAASVSKAGWEMGGRETKTPPSSSSYEDPERVKW